MLMTIMENFTNIPYEEIGSAGGFVLNTRRKVMLFIDIIIFIVGFFGNGSVIFITLKHKGLRTVPNYLITNLAIGDLMIIIFVVFINILNPLLPAVHPYSYHYCEFFYFMQFLSLGVSVFTLTALSVDRHTTVAYPMHKQRIARRLTMWTVASIWLTSIAVCCPWFTLIDDLTCWFSKTPSSALYLILLTILLFIVPTITMIFCYCLTAIKLLHRNASLNLDPRGGSRQQKKRSRLAVIVLVMTIVFVCCSTLVYVWFIAFYFSPNHPFVTNQVVKETKALLNKINSIANPIILYLMSTAHRHYFMCNFCFCFKFAHIKKDSLSTRPSTNGTDVTRQSSTHINGVNSRFTDVTSRDAMPTIKEEDSRV